VRDFWLKVVTAVLVIGVVTPATGAGNHDGNVVPDSPAVCVTLKLPQLPQPDGSTA
jgi:hypothetical protein